MNFLKSIEHIPNYKELLLYTLFLIIYVHALYLSIKYQIKLCKFKNQYKKDIKYGLHADIPTCLLPKDIKLCDKNHYDKFLEWIIDDAYVVAILLLITDFMFISLIYSAIYNICGILGAGCFILP